MKETEEFRLGEWYKDADSGCAFRCKSVRGRGEEAELEEYGQASVEGGWVHVKVTPIED